MLSKLFSPSPPCSRPSLFLSKMDFVAAAVDFFLTTGGATQLANHVQAVVGGVLPPQQQHLLSEHVNESSSQVSTIPLHIMGTQTLAIIDVSNTHQVVSLKLMKLSLLANADEALSSWSMCFSLR